MSLGRPQRTGHQRHRIAPALRVGGVQHQNEGRPGQQVLHQETGVLLGSHVPAEVLVRRAVHLEMERLGQAPVVPWFALDEQGVGGVVGDQAIAHGFGWTWNKTGLVGLWFELYGLQGRIKIPKP